MSVFTFLVLAIIVATVYFSYIAIVQIMQSGVFQQYLNAGGNIQQMMTGGALNLNGVDLTQMTNGATNLNGLDIQQMLDLVKNASGQQSN